MSRLPMRIARSSDWLPYQVTAIKMIWVVNCGGSFYFCLIE